MENTKRKKKIPEIQIGPDKIEKEIAMPSKDIFDFMKAYSEFNHSLSMETIDDYSGSKDEMGWVHLTISLKQQDQFQKFLKKFARSKGYKIGNYS